MNPTDLLKITDKAAGMNDRWLFLAAFLLLLCLCGMVIKWLVAHLQGMINEYKEMTRNYNASLVTITQQQNETNLKLVVCIDRNTAAMQDCERNRQRERTTL